MIVWFLYIIRRRPSWICVPISLKYTLGIYSAAQIFKEQTYNYPQLKPWDQINKYYDALKHNVMVWKFRLV